MRVGILLSTYNGQKYIERLFQSIENQVFDGEILICVRDDGSIDNTYSLIQKWSAKLKIIFEKGENIGPRDSFCKLLDLIPECDYYAFCDQDDIWHKDKIAVSVNALQNLNTPECIPQLYYSNVALVDQFENKLHKERYNSIPLHKLENIFVSNPALGCTIVFNHTLFSMIKKVSFKYYFMHDVVAMTVAASCGKIYYDSVPHMDYRQHLQSVTQGHQKFKSICNKIDFWFFQHDISIAHQAEEICELFDDYINPNTKLILEEVKNYKHRNNRWKLITNKMYRVQDFKCNRSFIIRIIWGVA